MSSFPGDIALAPRLRAPRRRVPVAVTASFGIIGVVVAMAILGAAIAPQDPYAQDLTNKLMAPTGAHWLGTDALGRDVFSRLVLGARTALLGPLAITIGSVLIGNVLGLLAGYRGGRTEAVIMRWVDLMWSVPSLLVIIVLQGALGGGYWLAVALLTLLAIPLDVRVVRGATLEQAVRPYVEAAKTIGVSDRRIMWLHIWPNVSATAVANAFLDFAGALVLLSSLSFLGLGADPGTAEWGLMLTEERAQIFTNPIATLAPAVAIVATAASMNLIGDWFYELLSERGASR